MGAIAFQITNLTIVFQPIIQAQIKENTKTPRHWPLCGEVTGPGEFPAQMASNAENVSIWWRHHAQRNRGYTSRPQIVALTSTQTTWEI